ncbi:MAG: UDP-3-O-acyl-N-acetylglucosamine deacetylase [Cyanothece sp. SIO1E1]|nr:UDP-3-O-acyl-N-acetylglucosamine deacetylase [Cyanothece sp. SIO1E1]
MQVGVSQKLKVSGQRSSLAAAHVPPQAQCTLTDGFERSGVGLHSGVMTQVRVLPAAAGTGRHFVRVDLPGNPEIPARLEAIGQTVLSTELVQGTARVRTVEHLLAALAGMGIDQARIEIDGPEVPLLDGSARPWAEAIAQVGMTVQTAPRARPQLPEPVWVNRDDAFVSALPATETRFTYGIDFELPAIGNQWHSWSMDDETPFAQEIAPARTFALADQIEQLRENGLIKGGSLENALVCGAQGWLNPPLRFSNEPVRHKLLDLVGDLSLLGPMPQMHVLAYKASHHLHTQLAQLLAKTLVYQ